MVVVFSLFIRYAVNEELDLQLTVWNYVKRYVSLVGGDCSLIVMVCSF
jgi:hypothetical protein